MVLTRSAVYDCFYDDYYRLKAFLHSHSYTGNPLGCRAALATLELFSDGNTIERNKHLAAAMHRGAAPIGEHPHVGEVRQTGMILAIEMVRDKRNLTPYPWQERRGLEVYQYALGHGVLLRPLGNVVYFMPPYVITPDEIVLLARVALDGIDQATRD